MEIEEMLERLKKGESPLELSIESWEDRREHMAGAGSESCALCKANPSCEGCVIYKATGEEDCMESPYEDFYFHPTKYNASRMVMFLKSLREE